MWEIIELLKHEKSELRKSEIDQTVICNKKHLPEVHRFTYESSREENDKTFAEKYADPAIFYPHIESSNFKRLKQIAEQKEAVGNIRRTDPFLETDTELQFLNSNPVSFFILGKPDVGQTEVAGLLSARWKCINLNPSTVIQDEIRLGSRIGKRFEFNLKCGRSIGPDVILQLVEKRVKSQTAQHRGFVISGFPIIQDTNAIRKPLITESTIINVKDALDEILPSETTLGKITRVKKIEEPKKKSKETVTFKGDNISEEMGEEGEETFEDSLEKSEESLEKLAESITKSEESIATSDVELEAIENALEEESFENLISNLYEREHKWTLADDLDVGATDEILIDKIDEKLCSVASQMHFLFNLFQEPFVIIYMSCDNLDVWHIRQNNSLSKQTPLKSKRVVTFSGSKSLISTTKDSDIDSNSTPLFLKTRSLISMQLREYKYQALPIIEKNVLLHNPEHFMKIDAHLSPTRIFETILLRLKVLAFPPVVIPELLQLELDEFPGEVEESIPECKQRPPEQYFPILRYQNVISPIYKLELSNWGYKCPVAMKHGTILKGSADKAVKFMNKIFFLSDDDAVLNFYRNPRFYISTIEQLPLKIWIMGLDGCGKTTLANSLSCVYNSKILDVDYIKGKYIKKEQLAYRDEISTKALEEALVALNKKRENEKETLIKEWIDKATQLLEEAALYNSYFSNTPSESDVIDKPVAEIGKSRDKIHEELTNMNLPAITEIELISNLLTDPKQIAELVPNNLTEPLKEVDPFHPFVVSYVDDILQHISLPEVNVTLELLANLIMTSMRKVDDDFKTIYGKKTSVIVDAMPVDLELLEALGPEYFADNIICLKDNDPEHKFLVDRLLNCNNFLNNIRKDSHTEPAANKNISRVDFIQKMVHEVKNKSTVSLRLQSDENLKAEITKAYTENIDEFNAKWLQVESYISQRCDDSLIVIDVSNKNSVQLMEEALFRLENKYREVATVMTEEDEMKEKEDYINSMRDYQSGPYVEVMEEEDEIEGEAEEHDDLEDSFLANRKFGNTGIYCPVSFFLHSVLWKGKEEYSVRFKSKLYFLSSEAAMHTYTQNPYKVLQPGFSQVFPPPRIVVIGALGSGKTTLAKSLADNFGLCYLHFDSLLLYRLNIHNLKNMTDILATKEIDASPKDLDIIKDYLLNDGNAASKVIYSVLNFIWFKEPYINTGFVLDGFPRRRSDVQLMILNYFIPDIVVELHVTRDDVQQRVFPIFFQEWYADLAEKQRLKQLENETIIDKWKYDRNERFNILLNQKMAERSVAAYESSKKPILTTPVSSKVSVYSLGEESEIYDDTFSYTEEQENEDIYEIEEILQEEMPEPQFYDYWEGESEAIERIQTEIDTNFTREIGHLDLIRPEIIKENIEHTLINTSGKSSTDVLNEVLKLTANYKYRDPAIFEQVKEISMVLADKLLEQGFYFLSKFGRLCPVQIYEKINPIHMYLPTEEMLSVYPLIHRRYIYFLNGTGNRDKFKKNPVLYVTNDDIVFSLIPIRIAIIGPPKCGKSTLAKRFQQTFGLKLITRGNAIRYFLNHLSEAELTKNMKYVLNQGWCFTDEMVISAVESITMDSESVAQGYILDGFPNTIAEMQQMASHNIIPFVVLDLQADLMKIKECTEACKKEIENPYTFDYIKTVYTYWKRNSDKFRDWLRKEYQNIYPVCTSKSKWHVWVEAEKTVFAALRNIHNYFKENKYDKPHIVNSLGITSLEFSIRQSIYKNYCPCCLCFNNLYYRESTSDWKNIILYRQYYYGICPEHVDTFMKEPDKFIPPENTKVLPIHLPVIVNETVTEKIHQDGFCIVTFWDAMPKHVLVKGDPNLIVRYRKKHYFFCKQECLKKFMFTPEIYYNKIIHFRKSNVVKISDIGKLPTLGYLEQGVAKLLTEALVNTELVRPFCPGIGIEKSAMINVALYLKRHNPKTRKEVLHFVEEGFEKFENRRKGFKKALFMFKSRPNPFLDILCHKRKS